ncbi:hypothetical protein CDL12_29688 [Handroanthus impetiginosus]|uniref:Uncharacterized protein n=1 Tax=Handroanthus impetiginosus TaxID=429701 RepID=A0A2G9FXQ2_9LAMI|nr:hypothetical protein CDL12_29688 [Handroanthus impetiginosus]
MNHCPWQQCCVLGRIFLSRSQYLCSHLMARINLADFLLLFFFFFFCKTGYKSTSILYI